MFGCCFQKRFFVLENGKHSKTCLTIVPSVFKFVLHVLNLVFLENNLKLFSPFSTLWTEQKKKKKKNHMKRTNYKPSKNASYNKLNQIPNPHTKNKPTNPKICVLKFFSPNFLLQIKNWWQCWWWWQCCNLNFTLGNGGG